MTGEENPFYEYYDEILDICREYDVTISLGDACRPGCFADATDVCQIEELVRLGELTKRAWEKDVQVMVEGPGHVPMDQIAANMKVQQTICMGAPFLCAGSTGNRHRPGYDHITAAIGGAYRCDERRCLPVLCHSCRASCSAQPSMMSNRVSSPAALLPMPRILPRAYAARGKSTTNGRCPPCARLGGTVGLCH